MFPVNKEVEIIRDVEQNISRSNNEINSTDVKNLSSQSKQKVCIDKYYLSKN